MNKKHFIKLSITVVAMICAGGVFSVNTFAADTNITNGITVDSTLDTADANVGNGECDDGSGNCTLRAAIEEANSNADTTEINFNITGTPDFTNQGQDGFTIAPTTPLPSIDETITIDGYSQPGAQANTAMAPSPLNGILLIEIDGSNQIANNVLSIETSNSSGSSVSGLVINNSPFDGIGITTVDNVVITGNYIGTDPTGLLDEGNENRGIGTSSAETNNNIRIGGLSPSERNLISGSNLDEGISIGIGASNWTIQGNYIGVDSAGTSAISNGGGAIGVNTGSTGTGNLIGGPTESGAVNVISGNSAVGVYIGGGSWTFQGNIVGTDYTGAMGVNNAIGVVLGGGNTSMLDNVISSNNVGVYVLSGSNKLTGNKIGTLPNGSNGGVGNVSDGIRIIGGASNNVVGGVNESEANIIAYNGGNGINIASVSVASLNPDNNSLLRNRIHENAAIGIDHADDSDGDQTTDIDVGPTLNDPTDSDTGPNNYINFPVLNKVVQEGAQATVNFNLDSADSPTDQYRVEFFSNDTPDPSGYGEGQTFLGSATVTNGDNQQTSFTLPTGTDLTGKSISATTTALDGTTVSGFGSTSEFSRILLAQVTGTANNQVSLASTGSSTLQYILIATATLTSSTFVGMRVIRKKGF